MKHSEIVWKRASKVYKMIIDHPFNQELMDGSLDRNKFNFYIKQDSLFLKDFSKSLATIASRLDKSTHIEKFLHFAQNTISAEQMIVNKYIGCNGDEAYLPSPATLSYKNFLQYICVAEPISVAVAGVLPCFWIYLKVGQYIFKNSINNNPYEKWISTYSNEQFAADVSIVISIFDELANNSSKQTKEKMSEAFYQSSMHEYHFWNDAYELKVLR
jgi:thiaminase/transcriptional activator TenA